MGLPVQPQPHQRLKTIYDSTLKVLTEMPPSAVYRQSVETLIKSRLAAVNAFPNLEDIHALEQKIGAGQVEEVIKQAEDELSLAKKMIDWKPWEALKTQAPPGRHQSHCATNMNG